MRKPPKRKANTENIISVPVLKVENKELKIKVPVIGKLIPREKVEIFSEVSGIMQKTNKDFLEGISFRKGELMLDINSDETRQSLKSMKSDLMNLISKALPDLKFDYPDSYKQWYDYLNNFEIDKKMVALPEPIDNREKFFISGKGIYKSYYTIESQEVRLSKYKIYAPFDGVVTNSNIKPGTLVRGGQKLGAFVKATEYELEVSLSLKDIPFVKVGDQINLYSDIISGNWKGKISRINNAIDTRTQTVLAYIAVSSSDLKEGMYLKGNIDTGKKYNAVELSRKLLIDKDKVFAVEGNCIKKIEVDVIQERADMVVVKGIKEGTIISRKTKNIHDGLKVKVAI
jgi:multidrug efflux pump subunit AcrA (membrane-fusion protein)